MFHLKMKLYNENEHGIVLGINWCGGLVLTNWCGGGPQQLERWFWPHQLVW